MSQSELGYLVLLILLVLVYESQDKLLSESLPESSELGYFSVLGLVVATRTEFLPDLRGAVFLHSAVLCAVYLLHVVHQYHFKLFLVTDL